MTMPEEFPAAAEESDGDSRRKLVLVAGGLLGTVVLGAGAWLLLGGSDEVDDTVVPRSPRTSAALADAKPADPAAVLPPRSEERLGRNPFRVPAAVIAAAAPVTAPQAKSQPAAAGGAGAAGAAVPAGAAAPGPAAASPAKAPAKAPAGVAAPAPKPKPGQPTAATYPLKLNGFRGDVARITVDGVAYEVEVDQVFGPKNQIKLLSIQEDPPGQEYVVLQVGDETFDVRVGETHQVR